MKKVTVRGFYRNRGLVDALAEGERVLVTAGGKPKFILSKSRPPRMTRRLAEARSVGGMGRRKFDGAAFLKRLKK